MMGKAYFFKDINNINELISKTKTKSGSENHQYFNILEEVQLNKIESKKILKDFKYNYSFLVNHLDNMKIKNNVWNCILLSGDFEHKILICTNGYLYPAFSALLI